MLFKTAGANYYAQKQQLERANRAFKLSLGVFGVFAVMFMPELAFATGLTQAKTGLENFLTEVQPMIRIIGVLAIIITGIGYMMGMMDKSMFFKIVFGLIIIASAGDIVGFFYKENATVATG